MKIVTINVQESIVNAIDKLVAQNEDDDQALYPSRSELVRVAVREFLLKELRLAKNIVKFNAVIKEFDNKHDIKPNKITDLDQKEIVRVPIDNEKKEFKTYRIIKKLETPIKPEEEELSKKEKKEIKKHLEIKNEFSHLNDNGLMQLNLKEKRKLSPNLPDYKYINEASEGNPIATKTKNLTITDLRDQINKMPKSPLTTIKIVQH